MIQKMQNNSAYNPSFNGIRVMPRTQEQRHTLAHLICNKGKHNLHCDYLYSFSPVKNDDKELKNMAATARIKNTKSENDITLILNCYDTILIAKTELESSLKKALGIAKIHFEDLPEL